jgi:hypothetical protein
MARIRPATPKAGLAFLPLDQADLASIRTAYNWPRRSRASSLTMLA